MTPPRPATPTVSTLEDYCQAYRDCFPDVRAFERFESLLLGLLSDLPRKSLPAIARHLDLPNSQGLDHFLRQSPWSVQAIQQRRLDLVRQVLGGRPVVVLVDETGDRKKGTTTDYVKRQYIGRLGKIDNGIVAVTLVAVADEVVLPLTFDVFKPKDRLKEGEPHESKPEIAVRLLGELMPLGLNIAHVSADCGYGNASCFVSALERWHLPYLVSVPSDYGFWRLPGQRLRSTQWRRCERHRHDGTVETRWVREWVFGQRHARRLWQLTDDPETMPLETTVQVMSWGLPEPVHQQWRQIADRYGARTWIEANYRDKKSKLGWSDFRVTRYRHIERWWEMVCCAELLVSLLVPRLHDPSVEIWSERLNEHLQWQLPHSWRSSWTALQVVLRPWFAMLTLKHSLRQVGGWSTARATFRSFERVFERAWRTVFEPLLPRLPTLKYRN